MQILRLNNSSTLRNYELRFDTQQEASLRDSQLVDAAESFNYGGQVLSRNAEKAIIQVFID